STGEDLGTRAQLGQAAITGDDTSERINPALGDVEGQIAVVIQITRRAEAVVKTANSLGLQCQGTAVVYPHDGFGAQGVGVGTGDLAPIDDGIAIVVATLAVKGVFAAADKGDAAVLASRIVARKVVEGHVEPERQAAV